ncbi:hypothetical protein ACFZAG_32875 [Streptomyces sp. NPDC012403]|uniref:hypothetical protein n=1 Tax=Streptomyces sp. NPDC012403 TaxID=3364831 RepID=UPI0036E65A2A
MSELGNGEGDALRPARTYGRASDNAQVIQSGGNQYVTNIHIVEAQGEDVREARTRADKVVQALAHAVGEWMARCQELEEQAKRAKAEGRAEAHTEFAGKLRDAELRVMQAQRMMRQAEEERARAEALLARTQRELARQRREAERDRDTAPRHEPVGLASDRQDTEEFSDLLERAESELGAVREELRQLSEEINGQGGERDTPQVIEGEWTQRSGTAEQPTPARLVAPNGDGGVPVGRAPGGTSKRTPVPGPPRRLLIAGGWALCALPPWIPMLAVTVNRAAYASDASLWEVVPFTFFTALVGVVGCLLALVLAAIVTLGWLDRDSETNAGVFAFLLSVVASVALFVAGFFTPLDWPGPAGAWGRGLASFMGLG